VLDGKFEKFSQLVIENNVPDAVKQYQYNQKYYNRVKSVGVDINWPSMYNEVYEDIKDEYISKLHYSSLELINEKKYEKAEEQFAQIAELDSTYKEVTVVRMSTVLEPLYQRGLRMMKNKNYKEAYFSFEKILEYDAKYKDSKSLKADALAKATITIGVLPMGNQTKLDKEESQLYSQLVTKIQQITNPFIKVLDKSGIENRLTEKQLELCSGFPTEPADQDTLDDVFVMEQKEIDFWNKVNVDPEYMYVTEEVEPINELTKENVNDAEYF
jgi:tetratricopeptide (TPR) repeat protein